MTVYEPVKKHVGDHTFFLWPFKAFVAANLSGELMNLVVPIISAVLPFAGNSGASDGEKSLLDVNIDEAAPALAGAFNSISGDKLESMLKKLLIVHGNITVDIEDEKRPGQFHTERLTEEIADEIFCGEVQDMFILAFEVIRLNLNGFFKRLTAQFGSATEKVAEAVSQSLSDTATST